MARLGQQLIAAHHLGEHQQGLLQGKGRPWALARPQAKRQKGLLGAEAILGGGRFRQEALGAKAMGIAPVVGVALDHPRRERHQRAHRAATARQLVIDRRLADEKTHRRIEAQGFIEQGRAVGQLAQFLKVEGGAGVAPLGSAGLEDRRHLLVQPPLGLRKLAEEIGGHGQGAGRGFMARQKQKAHLIHQLVAAEAAAGFGVLRLNQGLQQILGRRAWILQALVDGGLKPAPDRAGMALQVALQPPLRQPQQPQHQRLARPPLVAAKGRKNRAGLCRRQGPRQDRAHDHIGCDQGHLLVDVHGPGLQPRQPRQKRLHRAAHLGEHLAQLGPL